MLPTPSDVHVNVPMTNISVMFTQRADAFVATRVFPSIPVQKQSDRYYVYSRADFYRDEMRARAPATESAGGGYNLDNTPTYFATVYAFHRDIADELRANADAALNLDREATIYCTHKAMIKREKLWVSRFFTSGVWGTDVQGVPGTVGPGQTLQWNDASSTPIEDVRDAKRRVLETTGYMPNKLTLGRPVFDKLLDHPDIIDRIKYGQTPGAPAIATRDSLARLFEVDEVLVCDAVENTAAEGATASYSFIAGKHALLSYAPPAPGIMTPSAGYTFSWTGMVGAENQGTRMLTFRMPHLKADRMEIEMAFDQKVVAPELGFFFYDIVA